MLQSHLLALLWVAAIGLAFCVVLGLVAFVARRRRDDGKRITPELRDGDAVRETIAFMKERDIDAWDASSGGFRGAYRYYVGYQLPAAGLAEFLQERKLTV